MATQVFLADKTTLDSVKAKVDTNLNAAVSTRADQTTVNTINTKLGTQNPSSSGTDTVMNYLKKIDSNFPINLGADWSQATVNKCVYAMVVGSGNTATFNSLLNVTGKGYLSKVLCNNDAYSTIKHLKITVDNVLRAYLRSDSGAASLFGVMLDGDYVTIAGRQNFTIYESQMTTYPDTSNTKTVMKLAQPIYFNTSLKIELSSANTQSNAFEYSYAVL